jgi:hypothetical protein
MTTPEAPLTADTTREDRHGHRFLLIGEKKIFAYHLGLYYVPVHAYQMITSFGLADSLRTLYLEDLDQHRDQRVYYSLFSEGHWPLTEITEGTRDKLPVELERVTVDAQGNRTFTKLLDATDATCRKEDVVYFQPLDAKTYPERLTYLAFGRDLEVHLAHQLAAPKNWDEVITVTSHQGFRPADLDRAAAVVIPTIMDPHGPVAQSPLTTGQRYEGALDGRKVAFTAGRQGWWNNTSLNDK